MTNLPNGGQINVTLVAIIDEKNQYSRRKNYNLNKNLIMQTKKNLNNEPVQWWPDRCNAAIIDEKNRYYRTKKIKTLKNRFG